MASPSAPATGETVVDGRYWVEAVLGRGGMGTVYKVRDEATSQRLALKRLHRARTEPTGPSRETKTHAELRFRREFHTIAGLRHPCIVEAHDFGFDARGPYYTMELLAGDDLRDLGRCGVQRTCELMRQVASALALLHARRLLHRDLKARNVRCGADGRARLLDFGVLATIGVAGDIAGTPPSIPPEALRGLPLDGRSDLFGLGALTYWMLTGRHAFGAHDIHDLEQLWAGDVPPPSAFGDDVPPALDALVMSLLAIDRAERPRDAAEAIARFEAAANLNPDPALEVARGWVQSSSLVGRESEVATLTRHIEEAVRGGRGSVVIIDAASGLGKTRLLREVGLLAQMRGATVVRARATRSAGVPYGVIVALAEAAVVAMPLPAADAANAHPSIRELVPALCEDTLPISLVPDDPGEQRLRRQQDLRGWFLALARRRPVVVVIDDLQRCDEASAAVLASLGHEIGEHALAILASHRTDEDVVAQQPLRALRRRASILELRGLDETGVEALCEGMLGDVRGVHELASWIHELARGSPLQCTELCRHLIEAGHITYDRGSWQIPPRLDAIPLPAALAETVELRLVNLDPLALQLGEALSLVSGRFDVELCTHLLAESDANRVFAALDALVQNEVLLEDERGLEFRHDSLREALRRRIDPESLPRLHAAVARVLESASDAADLPVYDRLAEIGWHWLAAGEDEHGAALLERAGLALYASQSFADAVPPLEAALTVILRDASQRKRALVLRRALMLCGVLSDHHVVRRHATEAIEAYVDDAGIGFATSMSFLGTRLALVLGLFVATVRWLFTARRRLNPLSAYPTALALITYAATVQSLAFDPAAIRELLVRLRAVSWRNRVPEAATRLVDNFLALAQGRWSRVIDNAQAVRRIVEQDRLTPVQHLDRVLACGTADFMAACVLALEQNPRYLDYTTALRASELRFFEVSVHNVDAYFHRLRGEEHAAALAISRAELSGIQLGNIWVFESQIDWVSAIAYSFTGDVLGMERTAGRLRERVADGFRFGPFVTLLAAEQARARGHTGEAIAELDAALATCSPEDLLFRQLFEMARIDALLAKGDLDQVIAGTARVLGPAFSDGPCRRAVRVRVRAARTIALARLERHENAREELSGLLEEAAVSESPLLVGIAHEAGALAVHHAGEDHSQQREHALRCAAAFAKTRNPMLVARGNAVVVSSKANLGVAPQPAPPEDTVDQSGSLASDRSATDASGAERHR